MNAAAPAHGDDRELRRRNVRLGLVIGAIVVAIVVVFMATFAKLGLPKDPDAWQKMQQRESAAGEAGAPGKESER